MVATHELAGMLDSLVRVPRRDEWADAVFRAGHAQVGQKCSPTPRQAAISPSGGLMQCTGNGWPCSDTVCRFASDLMHHCYMQQAITRAHSNLARLHWCHPCPIQQVQTLLPLFTEYCFTFPSWYLFAMGLEHRYCFP